MQREYNGYPNSSGVYRIRNLLDGKVYIGSCKVFKQRAGQHSSRLEKNKHHNRHLQNAWNKYGSNAFLFEVLKPIAGGRLERTAYEQKLFDEHCSKGTWSECYNNNMKAVSHERSSWSLNQEGFSNEHKSKISNALKKFYKENPKACQEISKRMMGARTRLGQKHTKETKEKMSIAQSGRKTSEETRQKLRIANLGKKLSLATREKIKRASTGRRTSPAARQKISLALKDRLSDPEERKRVYGRKKSKAEREKISKSRMGIRILKDRGYIEEVNKILQLILKEEDLPVELQDVETGKEQLRDAYNRWNKGSKNPALREKHKQEKLRLKEWLQKLNLWYDARSDSWNRKSDEDKANAIKNLQTSPYRKSNI